MDALVECAGWECRGCAVCATYGIDWATAPTKAQVRESRKVAQRAQEAAQRAARLAAWRAANPQATCSDGVAMMLADLEDACKPRGSSA